MRGGYALAHTLRLKAASTARRICGRRGEYKLFCGEELARTGSLAYHSAVVGAVRIKQSMQSISLDRCIDIIPGAIAQSRVLLPAFLPGDTWRIFHVNGRFASSTVGRVTGCKSKNRAQLPPAFLPTAVPALCSTCFRTSHSPPTFLTHLRLRHSRLRLSLMLY